MSEPKEIYILERWDRFFSRWEAICLLTASQVISYFPAANERIRRYIPQEA